MAIWILDEDTVVDRKQGNTNENPIPDDGTTTLWQPPVDLGEPAAVDT